MKPLALVALAVLVLAGIYWLWPEGGGPAAEKTGGATPLAEVLEPAGGTAAPAAARRPPDATPRDAGEEEPAAGSSESPGTEEEAEAQGSPPDPEREQAAAGMLDLLEQWHRADPSDRAQTLAAADAEAGAALRSLDALLDPDPARPATVFPVAEAAVFGPAFSSLARAWDENGPVGLERELRARTGEGIVALPWWEVLVRQGILRGESGRAASALGILLREMAAREYPRERILGLADAARSAARDAPAFLPFRSYEVKPGDSLIRIARHFRQQGLELRYGWIRLFNDKAGDTVQVGEELKIPTTPLHLEVWRAGRFAVLLAGAVPVRVFPVSVGAAGEETPLGSFTIQEHDARPKWYRRDGAPLAYGDPENALGEGWMGFKEKSSYGLHGTNSEETVGSFETQGCIRFHNAAIVELMTLLPVGARVVIHP